MNLSPLKTTEPATTQPVILRTDRVTRNVRMGQETVVILDGVTMELRASERLAIVGASGSGKSTLLGLLAGLDHASSGRIELFGQDLAALDEDQRARLRMGRIGFVFQSFQLLPALTALENVLLPLELNPQRDRFDARQRQQRATDALTRVGLSERARHLPRQLSGGEQQRVAIARAWVDRPALLFADEPTGNLDRRTGERVIDMLFDAEPLAGAERPSLVLVTHDESLAARCDRTLRLVDGRLLAEPASDTRAPGDPATETVAEAASSGPA